MTDDEREQLEANLLADGCRDPLVAAKAKQKQSQGGKAKVVQDSAQPPDRRKTRAELAKVAGVSHDTIAKAKFLQDNADERTKEQLRKGEVTAMLRS